MTDHTGSAADDLATASVPHLATVVGRAGLFTWGAGRHGSTFGGNAVACASALATLDLVEIGLMIGIELADHHAAAALEQACFRAGLLVLTGGPAAVRLAPPLVVTPDQADLAVDLVAGALAGP